MVFLSRLPPLVPTSHDRLLHLGFTQSVHDPCVSPLQVRNVHYILDVGDAGIVTARKEDVDKHVVGNLRSPLDSNGPGRNHFRNYFSESNSTFDYVRKSLHANKAK